MAKKKKRRKKNTVPEKIKQAQRINDLKRKLYQVFVAAGAKEMFHLLPPHEMALLSIFRVKPISVEAKEGVKIHPRVIDFIKKAAVRMMKKKTIKLCEGGADISLYDYMYVGEQVRYYIKNLDPNEFPEAKKIKDAFHSFLKITDEEKLQDKLAQNIAEVIAYAMSTTCRGIFTLHFDYAIEQEYPPIFYNRFLVNVQLPSILNVKIENEARKVYRLMGLAGCTKVIKAKLALDKIGLNHQIKNLKADVYIQKHALERMKERLDCLDPQLLNIFLMRSILQCNVVTNQKGQQLIEFRIKNAKVGYLTFKYTEGIIVIRTFLLITNNDTPEGEKLERQLGLEKLDKQYLGIDKLSAFAISDIEKNPTLKMIFEKAGCNGLFKISKFISDKDNSPILNAEKITDYLELSKTSSELNQNERTEHPAKTFSINV